MTQLTIPTAPQLQRILQVFVLRDLLPICLQLQGEVPHGPHEGWEEHSQPVGGSGLGSILLGALCQLYALCQCQHVAGGLGKESGSSALPATPDPKQPPGTTAMWMSHKQAALGGAPLCKAHCPVGTERGIPAATKDTAGSPGPAGRWCPCCCRSGCWRAARPARRSTCRSWCLPAKATLCPPPAERCGR